MSGRRRRGHGEGAIYQRPDGRWTAAVELGWQGGKRRRKYVYGRSRREVAQKLRQVQRTQQEGGVLADERTTVERYLTDWLEVASRRCAGAPGSGTSSTRGCTRSRASAGCGWRS